MTHNHSTNGDADRRIVLPDVPLRALSALRWPSRPTFPEGNDCWTLFVEHPAGGFAVAIGEYRNDRTHPFEVWVMGSEQQRGLGAVAKTLSMDMRSSDRAWLKMKLEVLAKTRGDKPFMLEIGDKSIMTSSASAVLANVVMHRVSQLGALEPEEGEETPVVNAMFARKEPKSGVDGTMSWTVDVLNPNAEDDFVLGLKEVRLPDGTIRPYSVWMAGDYPRELDGLCKLLSLDMRVMDPAWIGMKLRKLLTYVEAHGDFFAKIPGSSSSIRFPSTVAYMAKLMIHRFAVLGVLTEDGEPLEKADAAGGRKPLLVAVG